MILYDCKGCKIRHNGMILSDGTIILIGNRQRNHPRAYFCIKTATQNVVQSYSWHSRAAFTNNMQQLHIDYRHAYLSFKSNATTLNTIQQKQESSCIPNLLPIQCNPHSYGLVNMESLLTSNRQSSIGK